MTLHAYDVHPSQLHGIFRNVDLNLASKLVLINIEVVNAPIYYNILLGHSYMYTIRAINLTIFCLMMFPHEGKIMTIYYITYHDHISPIVPEHVFPSLNSSLSISSVTKVDLRIYTDPLMISSFSGLPP